MLSASARKRRTWITHGHPEVSISRQCALLRVARSRVYYTPNNSESPENLALMRLIGEQYLKRPRWGEPNMTWWLKQQGHHVHHKRAARLMRVMGLQAAVPGPHTSRPHPEHRIYPYLLRGMEIRAPDEVWCADITCVPVPRGFMYLVAVMDWFSRYVIARDVSNSMEAGFRVAALKEALATGAPNIFNTDQGRQFTSEDFTQPLLDSDVRTSMDGRGRALDNVFIERLWRSVKYGDLYLRAYADGHALHAGLVRYFHYYNHERPHSGLSMKTPVSCYKGG